MYLHMCVMGATTPTTRIRISNRFNTSTKKFLFIAFIAIHVYKIAHFLTAITCIVYMYIFMYVWCLCICMLFMYMYVVYVHVCCLCKCICICCCICISTSMNVTIMESFLNRWHQSFQQPT